MHPETLILFILLLMMALTDVLKLSATSLLEIVVMSVVWGIAGGVMIKVASVTSGLLSAPFLYSSLPVVVAMVESAIMLCYAFSSAREGDNDSIPARMMQRILSAYPGVGIFFAVSLFSISVIYLFPGVDFNRLALAAGSIAAALIFLAAFILKKIAVFSRNVEDLIYFCAILTILCGIIYSGVAASV